MNLALSEVLNLARKWQNASTEVRSTMSIESHEWASESTGAVIVEAEGIVITNVHGYETRIALNEMMRFSYADGMLKIGGAGWSCNLYEVKDPNVVRLG